MKVLINISEKVYNHIKRPAGCIVGNTTQDAALKSIVEGTVITDDITNGDMFKYLFGWIKYEVDYEKETVLVYTKAGAPVQFDLDWWTTPYKEEKH